MTEQVVYDEVELLELIAAGDQHAFEQLFNNLYPRLVIFTEGFTVDRPQAEDIVHEAFVKYWHRRDRFDAMGKIKSFLYTASRNAALNIARDRRRQALVELPDKASLPEDDTAAIETIYAEVLAALATGIDQLPEKYREMILLTYRDGLSTKQIAERLGITVSSVTTQRSRAVQLLRVALQDKYPLVVPLFSAALLYQVFAVR